VATIGGLCKLLRLFLQKGHAKIGLFFKNRRSDLGSLLISLPPHSHCNAIKTLQRAQNTATHCCRLPKRRGEKKPDHIWMVHATHMDESCLTNEWDISQIWMSRVSHMNEWGLPRIWIGHVSHMNASSCCAYEWGL